MEESRQETQNPPEKHHSLAVILVTIFLAIYLLFPVILIYPVIAYKATMPPPLHRAMAAVLMPDIVLAKFFPAYNKLVVWEAVSLFGMYITIT